MQQVYFKDLGIIDFEEAWNYQESLLKTITDRKLKNRNLKNERKFSPLHYLLLCEHSHVYTQGKSGNENNLLVKEDVLKRMGTAFYKINRGGDITYHGPGQIVGYPILDLDYFFNDVHKYMRYLEEVIIQTLAEYGLSGGRIPGLTGVWLDANNPTKARKICAFGVRLSRWVTMHGFALNVNCDLNYFNQIIPCGIPDKEVTSLEKELGRKTDLNEVKEKLKKYFALTFNCSLLESSETLLHKTSAKF